MTRDVSFDLDAIRFGPDGLVPIVVQEVESGAVRMLAWANREALERTLASGDVWFWSRSRGALWRKGETSGNTLALVEIAADCDGDAVLLRARASGPTCHTGSRTCFEPNPAALELGWLARVIASRVGSPAASSYTARLLAEGVERIAQKVGEEGVEVALAAVAAVGPAALAATSPSAPDRRHRLVGEAADLIYHLLVLLEACGVAAGDVAAELGGRHAARTAGSV